MVLLALAVVGTGAGLVLTVLQLQEADERIQQQQYELDEQHELIERKEQFAAAMHDLLTTARSFEGSRLTAIVPLERYQVLANRAWDQRRSASAITDLVSTVQGEQRLLERDLAEASDEAASNVSGTVYETVIDKLGRGFVTTRMTDAANLCSSDALACVLASDPYTVHVDNGSDAVPQMTDWMRTGIAYHEFAHVLQMTNPAPTETAAASFDDDWETMADCFALTYLDGWSLDHTVWINDFEYWEVSLGYGYTCNDTQRQVVRDWYEQLNFEVPPIVQR